VQQQQEPHYLNEHFSPNMPIYYRIYDQFPTPLSAEVILRRELNRASPDLVKGV
jgi:hypothetical protein